MVALLLGKTRFRCYAGYYQQLGRQQLSRDKAVGDFIDASVSAGAPREWFANVQVAGPLASFDCAETWVNAPYRAGIVLIGDAAATGDPTYGCGTSLVLRDVRVLSSLLLTEVDWSIATRAYAEEHDRYFGALHRLCDWLTKLLYEPGPAAEARRTRSFVRLLEDPKRYPDIPGLGPESPSDDAAFHNLFGEE
jgi:2-polyprenyl-6-methoxyphenol hydroxylase-like FAD-dependent oxidoreductase